MIHVLLQWFVMFSGLLVILDPLRAYQIACINAGLHGLIDWNVWRVYKRYVYWWHKPKSAEEFKYWEQQSFYSTIGFDQFLHHASIIVAIGVVL
jgi:hypothetical protein